MTATVAAPFEAADLSAALGRVLTAITDAAADLTDAVTLPARQIVSTAGVTWDCPMVYVSALTIQLGLPDPVSADQRLTGALTYPPGSNLEVWTVTVEAGIVRPLVEGPQVMGPSAAAPPVEAYAADLVTASSDTAVLMNALTAYGAANLQPVAQQPASASFLAAQGGFHGVAATATVEMFPGPPLPG